MICYFVRIIPDNFKLQQSVIILSIRVAEDLPTRVGLRIVGTK